MQHNATSSNAKRCNKLQQAATSCNKLQYAATSCNMLQQAASIHCNATQCCFNATPCNKQQQAAACPPTDASLITSILDALAA
jgi:hypothetical protein